ncbi:hypothetical protein AAMO2058_000479500 [Amorphochlora amoebiformis]
MSNRNMLHTAYVTIFTGNFIARYNPFPVSMRRNRSNTRKEKSKHEQRNKPTSRIPDTPGDPLSPKIRTSPEANSPTNNTHTTEPKPRLVDIAR